MVDNSHILRPLRPVTNINKLRIFNILKSKFPYIFFQENNVLDMFAGTGAFGAYSKKVLNVKNLIFVEKNKRLSYLLKKKFNNDKVICCSSERFSFTMLFDIVFLDPPYLQINAPYLVIKNLIDKNLIHDNSIIIIRKSAHSILDIDYKINDIIWHDNDHAIIFLTGKKVINDNQ